jgi:Uracil DNA glycosylase superfamily
VVAPHGGTPRLQAHTLALEVPTCPAIPGGSHPCAVDLASWVGSESKPASRWPNALNTILPTLEDFARAIPSTLMEESGKVFYSGRDAFSSPAPLYVLGVNPGGDPANYSAETVERHTSQVLGELSSDWSAYRDESWEGALPGTYGMAPRVLHLFRKLNLSPGAVPASNLFFVRSRREQDIKTRQRELADLCWPFHALVLEHLRPRVILCLGATAGRYVCQQLGAAQVIGEFVEQNARRWTSRAFVNARGLRVVVATHPSIADWCAQPTDPSGLIQEVLQ